MFSFVGRQNLSRFTMKHGSGVINGIVMLSISVDRSLQFSSRSHYMDVFLLFFLTDFTPHIGFIFATFHL
jgi:hypothetical protein